MSALFMLSSMGEGVRIVNNYFEGCRSIFSVATTGRDQGGQFREIHDAPADHAALIRPVVKITLSARTLAVLALAARHEALSVHDVNRIVPGAGGAFRVRHG